MFDFSAPSYYIWSPNYSGSEDILKDIIENGCHSDENEFDAPKLPYVPTLVRRRYSQMTKMVIEVASKLIKPEEQISIFFCSNFGEIQKHYEITSLIEETQETSPTLFSCSTHNTAVGQLSILFKNHKRSVALAASKNCFETAIIEVASFIKTSGEKKALLLIAEEGVPEKYKASYDKNINKPGVFCAGMIISEEKPNLRLKLQTKKNSANSVFDFMSFLSSSDKEICFEKSWITKL